MACGRAPIAGRDPRGPRRRPAADRPANVGRRERPTGVAPVDGDPRVSGAAAARPRGAAGGHPRRRRAGPDARLPRRRPSGRRRTRSVARTTGGRRRHRRTSSRSDRPATPRPAVRRSPADREADARPAAASLTRVPRPARPSPPAGTAGGPAVPPRPAGRPSRTEARRRVAAARTGTPPTLDVLEGAAAAHRGRAAADLPDPDVPGQGLRDPVRVDGDHAARLHRLQQRPGAGRQDQLPLRRPRARATSSCSAARTAGAASSSSSSRATRWSAGCSSSARWSGWPRRTRRTSSSG